MRAISMDATASLLCGGHASTPDARTSVMVLWSPPITPDCGETSLARIQSQRFASEFCLGIGDDVFRLGSKADYQFRPLRFSPGDGGEDVRIFHERKLGVACLELFLQFMIAGIGDAPVGDGGGEDRNVDGQRAFDRVQHVARAFDLDLL